MSTFADALGCVSRRSAGKTCQRLWLVLLVSFIALPVGGFVAAWLQVGVYPVQILGGVGAGHGSDSATFGTIKVGGNDLFGLNRQGIARHIAYVPQAQIVEFPYRCLISW